MIWHFVKSFHVGGLLRAPNSRRRPPSMVALDTAWGTPTVRQGRRCRIEWDVEIIHLPWNITQSPPSAMLDRADRVADKVFTILVAVSRVSKYGLIRSDVTSYLVS